MKFLNKINISVYSIIIIFLSLISGLFKEFIVISIIILFHEFGHFIFLYKYKWNIKEIKIYPFGGVCTLDEKIDKPLKEEFIISIMGLIFQELLFLIVFILSSLNFLQEDLPAINNSDISKFHTLSLNSYSYNV